MSEDLYRRLAEHLDDLPGGFPPTDSGVEIRILKRLFTVEEADMALHLTLLPETPASIARRAKREVEAVAPLLDTMSHKGLIFRFRREEDVRYAANQFVIGIWEFHVNDLDLDLIRDMNEYLPTLVQPEVWSAAPQLRTIPVGREIPVDHEILLHEQAESIVRNVEKIAVAPCICRREHEMAGQGCPAPMETCLVFDTAADYYLENGLARPISHEEALGILGEAARSGLVLQPGNARKPLNICCCCGCCCQVLKAFKRHPQPASIAWSPYRAVNDADWCIECGNCVSRCQMDALAFADGGVAVDRDRCIGCGLCTVGCPTGAMTLERKPEEEQRPIPATTRQMYLNLGRVRGKLGPGKMAGLALRAAKERIRSGKLPAI